MMKESRSSIRKITGGVYLVLNPAMDRSKMMHTLQQALEGGVDVLQIWNNWPRGFSSHEKEILANDIVNLAENFEVPVLINQEWEMLKNTRLHGVHFDEIPPDFGHIKKELTRPFLQGVTCSNNLEVIDWANRFEVDYISFCSMYPSKSAGNCEIVRPETVHKAREYTHLPLFVSGGVTPQNLLPLKKLGIDGVAVISGILDSHDPCKAAADYRKALQK
jgi:thiamine-phosphate pyrophosphorylase